MSYVIVNVTLHLLEIPELACDLLGVGTKNKAVYIWEGITDPSLMYFDTRRRHWLPIAIIIIFFFQNPNATFSVLDIQFAFFTLSALNVGFTLAEVLMLNQDPALLNITDIHFNICCSEEFKKA